KELKKIDPNYYQKVDLNNHSRLLRALEVQRQTGKTFSSLRKEQDKEREFTIITIVLNRDRKELYNRINTRVDLMLDAGLIKEAEKLHPFKHLVPLKTVGYRELFNYFEGNYSLQEAIEKIKSNSRHYARRQLTWFRRNKDAHWFNPGANDKIKNFINSII
ncbi:MAG: tRNA (adenosine(37)-N6)-dimethylallyltransferase MiaA, partial [Marinilabiliales bacterium]